MNLDYNLLQPGESAVVGDRLAMQGANRVGGYWLRIYEEPIETRVRERELRHRLHARKIGGADAFLEKPVQLVAKIGTDLFFVYANSPDAGREARGG